MKIVLSLLILFGAAQAHAQGETCKQKFFGYPLSASNYVTNRDGQAELVCTYAGEIPANRCLGTGIQIHKNYCQKKTFFANGRPVLYTMKAHFPRVAPPVMVAPVVPVAPAPVIMVQPRHVRHHCASHWFGAPFNDEYVKGQMLVCDYAGMIFRNQCPVGMDKGSYCQTFDGAAPGIGPILKSIVIR